MLPFVRGIVAFVKTWKHLQQIFVTLIGLGAVTGVGIFCYIATVNGSTSLPNNVMPINKNTAGTISTFDYEESTNAQRILPSRIFWTSDIHDGTRIDTPSVLVHLGQMVIVNGGKDASGPYPHVLERFILPGDDQRSRTIFSHWKHSDYMSEKDIEENFNFYKKNSLIASTDAFICSFPASFCELWMPFNKSIIFLPAHRFSLGRCSQGRFGRLIQHVQAMSVSKSPKHFIAAASVYDAEYLNYYTGLKPIVLSSSSFFYAGHGVTNYTKSRQEILVGPLQRDEVFMGKKLEAASAVRSQTENWIFGSAKGLYHGWYELQDIANHRAVVIFPYAVMSYGITEIYAMGVPILVPSIEMLVENCGPLGPNDGECWTGDRSVIDPYYCGLNMADELPPKNPHSRHPYSPDTYESKALAYWLQFADFYQWPHITIFDSFGDLIDKLEAMDFDDIHEKMMEANKKREIELLNRWSNVIAQIDSGRQVPNDYAKAIKALWNTTKLQVE